MGTDIHPVVQRRAPGGDWEFVKIPHAELPYDQRPEGGVYDGLCGRHYLRFSILADVRNGYGFAGCPTYEPVEPISTPRGLPYDFEEPIPPGFDQYGGRYADDADSWLGDHSFSWVSLRDLLDYDWDAPVSWPDGESVSLREACSDFTGQVIPWLASLGAPDDVRIVFGFDS